MATVLACVVVLTVILCGTGEALRCHTCSDLDINLGPGANRDITCEFSPSEYEECGSGESCGFFAGSMTVDLLLTKVSGHVVRRGCVPFEPTGCTTDDKTVREALKWLNDLVNILGIDKIDARVCACNTDLCDANICDGGFWVNRICVKWWYIAVPVGILVLLVGCCACCCCRSKNPRRRFNAPTVAHTTVTMTPVTAGTNQQMAPPPSYSVPHTMHAAAPPAEKY